MKRRVQFLAAAIAMALAVPASAQVKRRDHRKPKPAPAFEVKSWAPKTGPVGTKIVIEGRGFSRSTTVLFGGRVIRPRRITASEIWVIVPKQYGNGEIVLRNRGYGNDYQVGTYDVVTPPVVKRIAPARGVYGTRVEILGSGFEQGDTVSMGGRAIPVSKYSPDRLVIAIPDWATTDYLVVSRDSYNSRARAKFIVLDPAPAIVGINPDYGPPGATVRIRGKHFTRRDQVWYGRVPVAVVSRGGDWIEVVVPQRARRSQYFRIKGPGGETRSPQAYNLDSPPVIQRIEPAWGKPGDRVDLYGANFKSGDRVQLSGKWVKIVQLRPRQITVTVPQGAQSGAFVLFRGRTQVAAPSVFDVAHAPGITEWGPKTGEWGTRVTIRGTGFDNSAQVWYGPKKIPIAGRAGDHTIEVLVPRNQGNRRFFVKGKYGDARTGKQFQVELYPQLTDARPRRGAPGDRIALRGKNLASADGFWLGNVQMPIVQRRGGVVIVEVPKNARDARIRWTAYGRKWNTDWKFQYILPAEFTGYSPGDAWPGDEIVLRGSRFSNRTRVRYGNRALKVVNWKDNELRVQVPNGLRAGSDWLWVEGDGYKLRSNARLNILASPTFGGYGPEWGRAGTRVTLRGTNFSKSTRVTLGSWNLNVISWKPGRLVVEVPSQATPGNYWFWVQDGRYKERSKKQFNVRGYASVTGLSAKKAGYGDTLIIQGRDFDNGVRAFYGNTELNVKRRGPRGRRLWVVIPEGLTGSDWIYVHHDGNKARSPYKFEIEPPPPKIKRRDHRKKKKY